MNVPFNISGFRDLIQYFHAHGYSIRSFATGAANVRSEPICLMRHDVDHSLHYAEQLAHEEASLGVKATYFVMVNSDLYSVASRSAERVLRNIISLGHEIGFHWWAKRYPSDHKAFIDRFRVDLEYLSGLCGCRISSAAQHDPTGDQRRELSDLVRHDAYSPQYLRDIIYISDSNRRFRTSFSVLQKQGFPSLQLNLHPLYWVSGGLSMGQCVQLAMAKEIDGQRTVMRETIRYYQESLQKQTERDRVFRQGYQDGQGMSVA